LTSAFNMLHLTYILLQSKLSCRKITAHNVSPFLKSGQNIIGDKYDKKNYDSRYSHICNYHD
jgi:hypothetical protein